MDVDVGEVGAGSGVVGATSALGIGGVMKGTGVGRLAVPEVNTHAVSSAAIIVISNVRVTQVATAQRYAEPEWNVLV